MNEESIFAAAIEKPVEERQRYLDQVCGDNSELRARVESLLNAHEQPDSFLNNPVQEVEPTIDLAIGAINPGKKIGPYTLRERLGAGGMGVVWAAEQKAPLRRKVALKVIKPGMDTEQVIARFENEREALALMDHPNIAKVLDAGATEKGHPYFVMELICGVPITEYCDAMRLTVTERLELFIQVCNAVQHAHQKGIIHRDIKPNNVLVSEHDGTPIPKIIDFGIAKALHRRLTDHSIYTGVFQALGTLAYMSPEQAGLSVTDIDTRSDIYGLGVLLYELLTGDTPFEKEKLASAALNEACRIIREEDPPKPSSKVSTLGKRAHEVSEGRRTDPKELDRLISGDLDCIIGKTLEKDRKRRYETARDLATDVKRHLQHDVVEARPPSLRYRVRKAVRRNRTLFATGTLVACALVMGIVVSSYFAIRWKKEAERRRTTEVELRKTGEELKHAINDLSDSLAANQETRAKLENTLKEIGRVALRWAIQAAMFGDKQGGEEALGVAKEARADDDLITFSRAFLDLYWMDGHQTKAYEAAVALVASHDTLANRALLINTILWAGGGTLEEHYEHVCHLQGETPRNTLERFLVAQAFLPVAPDFSVRLLQACPVSPLQRGLLAQALYEQAIHVGDVELAKLAHHHINVAREFFPNSSMFRALHIIICIGMHQLSPTEEHSDYINEALRVVEEAKGSPAPIELMAHSRLFGLLDEESRLLLIDKALLDGEFWLDHALPRILSRTGYRETLGALNSARTPLSNKIDGLVGPKMLLLALDETSHDDVLAMIEDETIERKAIFAVDRRVKLLAAALLAGGRDTRIVSSILKELDDYDLSDLRRPEEFSGFIRGDVDETTFLNANEGACRLHTARFFSAIVAMSNGDRARAIEHFAVVRSDGPNVGAYFEWAKTLHDLLVGRDPLLDWVDDRTDGKDKN